MTTDDKILENDIQYMLRGCDPHDAEARRHIARCIIAYVREHDGRDAARFEWLVSKKVDVSYNPTPDDEVEIKLCINHDNDPRLVYHAGSDLRAAIDAAIAKAGK